MVISEYTYDNEVFDRLNDKTHKFESSYKNTELDIEYIIENISTFVKANKEHIVKSKGVNVELKLIFK